MLSEDSEPKKKRRQNVACDACKLRRVKCDLSELLMPLAPIVSSSTSEPPSLQVLVRANPDVGCSNCKNKGVKCTTEQILHPAKPNKGGKRIDEAKKRFGPNQAEPSGAELVAAGSTNVFTGGGMTAPTQVSQDANRAEGVDFADFANGQGIGTGQAVEFDWISLLNTAATTTPVPPSFAAGESDNDLLSNFLLFNSKPHPDPPDPWMSISEQLPGTNPYPHELSTSSDPAKAPEPIKGVVPLKGAWTQQPFPETSDEAHTAEDAMAKAQAQMADLHSVWRQRLSNRDQDAAPYWDRLHVGSKSGLPVDTCTPSESGPRFSSPFASTISEHLSISNRSNMPEMEFDAGLMSFVSRGSSPAPQQTIAPGHFPPLTLSNQKRSLHRPGPSTSISSPASLHFSEGSSALSAGRKRFREETTPDLDDEWKLWADAEQQQIVRWGRREAVQQSLADRALGRELSRHLVKTFFNFVHPSFPALSPEGFYLDWELAGQRSDRLSPAQETLCAVMEAWGARYSDSPVVLGLPPAKYAMAPRVIQKNGTMLPGSQARAHWGRSRLGVCNALVDRARRLIDEHGIMRQPSVTGLQALVLYNQLLGLTDQRHLAAQQYMENLVIHSSIVEQMRVLELMWDSTGEVPAAQGELPVTDGQMRMKQRRIFWTVLISDAFNAVASGALPKIPDEELDSVAGWLREVEVKLPMSTFKTLAFFVSCYYRLALVARFAARKLTYPNRRPGTIDIPTFCKNIRECWVQTKSIARDVTVITTELLQSCEHSLIGFSPLNYITNLRLSCPFLLLVLHQTVCTQLDFRNTLKESFVFDESPKTTASQASSSANSPSGRGNGNLTMLEELHTQSVDILLDSCRSQINMYKTLLPTGMVQTAAVFLRVLIASAQFLAEIPTVEQGYPANTLGGYGWTWETKQKEVQICVDGLHQLGWAWSDVSEVLEQVMLSMERMVPTQDQLDAYRNVSIQMDDRIVLASQVAGADDDKLLKRAMTFWPPPSVSDVLEDAMKTLKIGEGLDIDSQHVPWDQLRLMRQGSPGMGSAVTPGTPGGKAIVQGLEDSLTKMGHPPHDLAAAARVPFGQDDHRASKSTWSHASATTSNSFTSRDHPHSTVSYESDERPAKRQMFNGDGSDFLAGLGTQESNQFDPFAPTPEPIRQAQAATWTTGPGQQVDDKRMDMDGFDQDFMGQWLDFHSPKSDVPQMDEGQIPLSIEELLQSFQQASQSL